MPELPPTPQPLALLKRRPDVQAAALRITAAGADVSAAEKALLPSINLIASGGYAENELDQLFSPSGTIWSLIAGITQPIFQGGQLRAQIRIENARQAEAVANYGQTIIIALSEVEEALEREELLSEELQQQAAAVEAAQSRLRLAKNNLPKVTGFIPGY